MGSGLRCSGWGDRANAIDIIERRYGGAQLAGAHFRAERIIAARLGGSRCAETILTWHAGELA